MKKVLLAVLAIVMSLGAVAQEIKAGGAGNGFALGLGQSQEFIHFRFGQVVEFLEALVAGNDEDVICIGKLLLQLLQRL